MRREMHIYIQTRLADFSDCRTAADMELTNLGALKTLLSEVLIMASEQREIRRELREVRDSLHRSLSGDSSSLVPPANLSSYHSQAAMNISKTCVCKTPSNHGPQNWTKLCASCPEPDASKGGEMEPAITGNVSCQNDSQVLSCSHGPEPVLSAAPAKSDSDTDTTLYTTKSAESIVASKSATLESDGALRSNGGWLAGLVTNICGRAAEISSDVTSSFAVQRSQPMHNLNAMARTTAQMQLQKVGRPQVQEAEDLTLQQEEAQTLSPLQGPFSTSNDDTSGTPGPQHPLANFLHPFTSKSSSAPSSIRSLFLVF